MNKKINSTYFEELFIKFDNIQTYYLSLFNLNWLWNYFK